MDRMFGRYAFELLQEVATCPAESLPSFNVSSSYSCRICIALNAAHPATSPPLRS
jgi:hypothetical protein